MRLLALALAVGALFASNPDAFADPRPLQIQATHDGGLVVQINSIEAKPSETVLGVKLINGNTRTSQFLMASPQDSYLLAGSTKLYLSAPADNSQVIVDPGLTVEGELVFLGAVPQGTKELTLVFNEDGSSKKNTRAPKLEIAIPLAEGAVSADDSKKN